MFRYFNFCFLLVWQDWHLLKGFWMSFWIFVQNIAVRIVSLSWLFPRCCRLWWYQLTARCWWDFGMTNLPSLQSTWKFSRKTSQNAITYRYALIHRITQIIKYSQTQIVGGRDLLTPIQIPTSFVITPYSDFLLQESNAWSLSLRWYYFRSEPWEFLDGGSMITDIHQQ